MRIFLTFFFTSSLRDLPWQVNFQRWIGTKKEHTFVERVWDHAMDYFSYEESDTLRNFDTVPDTLWRDIESPHSFRWCLNVFYMLLMGYRIFTSKWYIGWPTYIIQIFSNMVYMWGKWREEEDSFSRGGF